jgi:2-methylcitrate dehydratase PrpD
MSHHASPSELPADALQQVLDWVERARCDDLPEAVVRAAKDYLLNTVAAMLSGSTAPGAAEIVAQVREWGGREQCVVVAHGLEVPAPLAALANGVMAHALDFDDTQVGTGLHANVSLVPALLAAAQLRPSASGRDFLLAHVTGLEVSCRLTLAAMRRSSHPWLTTTLFGIFGATVSAAKLLGLDATQTRHAVGIAYSSAGGNRQGLLDGTLVQRIQPGLCAQAALTAVALAARGVTGAIDVLEGRYGLYPCYYGDDHDLAALTDGLGQSYRMLDIAIKAYPCCSYSQEPIEAALHFVRAGDIEPAQVERAVAYVVSDHAAGLIGRPYAPRSCAQVDAQFSIQYVIAAALVRRRLGLADFNEPALHDPAVLALAPRVHVLVDPKRAGTLELHLRGGAVLSKRVLEVAGHPGQRLGADALAERLRQSSDCAHAPRTEEQLAALLDVVGRLDEPGGSGAEIAYLLT